MLSQEQLPNPNTAQIDPNATLNGVARGVAGVAGYQVQGINLLDMPGTAAKVVGVGMIAAGIREQYVGIAGNETSDQPAATFIRNRVNGLGQSLVDKNSGKTNLASRLKRGLGEELLSYEDRDYRTRFARVVGGSVMLMSGVQLMTQPTNVERVAGGLIASVGFAEQVHNTLKSSDRQKELISERHQ